MEREWLKVACPQCDAGARQQCRGAGGETINPPHTARVRRGREEADFWAWVDHRLGDPENRGLSEQEFLDRNQLPGWTGMKARTHQPVKKVVTMPSLDFKMAAAGDGDEAA